MNTTRLFQVLGVVLILVGLLGFVNNPILGLFTVNVIHNLIHIITGAILLWAAMPGGITLGMTARVLGVVYAIVTVLGFAAPGLVAPLLGSGDANALLWDNLLHVLLAVVLLYIGFVVKAPTTARAR